MKQEFDDIEDLIGKVLTGEASADEQLQLSSWTEASDENKRRFDQMRLVFELAASNKVRVQFDTDAAWVKMKEQIRKSSGRSISFFPGLTMIRMAATVAILVSAGIFAYRYFNPPIDQYTLTAGFSKIQDTLPDGSTAFLNKKSVIEFEFNHRQKTRKVKLKGEGFFEIKHENEKPFIIETDQVMIRDIGTAFNVRAYPESDTVEVMVTTGEVQFYTMQNEGLHLHAGETGIYSKRMNSFSLLELTDMNTLAYKTGVLSFNNTDLKTVVDKINEVYNSRIELKNPQLSNCHITVSFHDDTLDTIVEVIAETLRLTVTRENDKILLDGADCR